MSRRRRWHPTPVTLAWKIPWTEEPGRLQSMGSRRVGHDWATSLSLFIFYFHALEKEMATHSSVLAWRIPGTGQPGGLPSMGLHWVGTRLKRLSSSSSKRRLLWSRSWKRTCAFGSCADVVILETVSNLAASSSWQRRIVSINGTS